jgi:hypothetical protein
MQARKVAWGSLRSFRRLSFEGRFTLILVKFKRNVSQFAARRRILPSIPVNRMVLSAELSGAGDEENSDFPCI